MLKFINKLFGGSKSEKDVKKLLPVIDQIGTIYNSFQTLSHDELRAKSFRLREKIQEHVADISQQIKSLREEAETTADIHVKSTMYKSIDELVKEKDKQLEEVLLQILPEAFAIVKDASRRFKENTQLRSTATELDRALAVKKDYVTIEGDESIFNNTWTAGGGQVTWNMVHYDVQLIGGYNLHEGKISEMATGEGKTLVSTLPAYLNGLD